MEQTQTFVGLINGNFCTCSWILSRRRCWKKVTPLLSS